MPLLPLPEPWRRELTVTIEQRILGCCLFPLSEDHQHAMIRQVMQALPRPEDWSHPWHWEIARMLWAQSEEGKTVEPAAVLTPLLGTVPASYIHDLCMAADTALLLPQRLEELRRRREAKATLAP